MWDGDAIFLSAAARLLRLIPRYHSEVIRSAAETARPRARRWSYCGSSDFPSQLFTPHSAPPTQRVLEPAACMSTANMHGAPHKGLPERCAAAGVLEWAECYLT